MSHVLFDDDLATRVAPILSCLGGQFGLSTHELRHCKDILASFGNIKLGLWVGGGYSWFKILNL